ncbi:hypothetical protein BDN70DRAFT_932365 [Pholiota conissans]|uniref:Uncharacterized protein n=1 Tax=Pholiota conissans TaxID=109636 RepID=A0A9P5Z499_9AGAR|nr:hypothetical protein BDN70DRAFT_932365 [Pholiota conissans]
MCSLCVATQFVSYHYSLTLTPYYKSTNEANKTDSAVAMGTPIETITSATRMLAANVTSPVVLICGEENRLNFYQFGSANFPFDVIQSTLNLLRNSIMNSSANHDDPGPIDILNEEDEADDDYEKIANILNDYDFEDELQHIDVPKDTNSTSESIESILNSVINNTAAFLEGFEEDDLDAAQAPQHEHNKSELNTVNDLSDRLTNLQLNSNILLPPAKQEIQKAIPDLATTQLLRANDLVFNTRYGLLICSGCHIGLPLSSAAPHLSSGFYWGWDEAKETTGTIPAAHRRLFMIYFFIDSEGGYHSIHHIPPLIAKHQYCMRLRGFREINVAIEKAELSGWISIATDFVDTYLASFGDSPFSIIRLWMHALSVVAKSTPRPNLIWWKGDTMLMAGNDILFSEYRQKTYKQLLQLENFILDKVLLGTYTMEEAETQFNLKNLMETGDEKTPGHGVIADTTTPLMNNTESDIFFQQLFKEKKLGFQQSKSGGIDIDYGECAIWLGAIDQAFWTLVALCHITVIAGRGTEWLTISPTNNKNGPKGVVYDPGAQTAAFNAAYHKGLNIQGVNKHNRRYMPYEIFRLLYLLIRVVRPTELLVLMRTVIPEQEKSVTIQAYQTHIFASLGRAWTSSDISRALQIFFKNVLNLSIGLHDYRHMVIAIQRKHMKLKAISPSPMEEGLSQLRGHQKVVGDSHYAREIHLGSCDPDHREVALSLARQYHRIMGFATGFDDELPEESQKQRAEFCYQPPSASNAIHPIVKKIKGKKRQSASVEDLPASDPPPTPHKVTVQAKVQAKAIAPEGIRRSQREKKPTQKFGL